MHTKLSTRISIIILTWLASSLAGLPPHPFAVTAQQDEQTSDFNTPLQPATMCEPAAPDDVHFTIAATGDTLLHRNIQYVAEQNSYDYLFDYIRFYIQAADIAYTNLEGPMMADNPYTGYPAFNYNPALANALKRAGFDVVSTANNHILDRGQAGVAATLAALDKAGIAHHGAVLAETAPQDRSAYTQLTHYRNGVRLTLAFISVTWGTNGIPDPHNQANLLWTTSDYGQGGEVQQPLLETIARAKQENDLVIVAPHWGFEYVFTPSEQQQRAAHQLAEAGADIILGGHPHTLQPVDLIDTNDGRTAIVIYSLGNCIASQGIYQAQFFTATSVIWYVGIVKKTDGEARVTGYRYLPTMMVDYDTRPTPIPPDGGQHDHVIAHVRAMMRDSDGALQVYPDEIDAVAIQQARIRSMRLVFNRHSPVQQKGVQMGEVGEPLLPVCR